MSIYARFIAGLGRSLVSIIFIVIGLSQIFYWEMAEKDLSFALANWELYSGNANQIGEIFTGLLSIVPVILITGIVLQLIGGVFLFFNFRVRLASFLLLIYLFIATLIYHPFWYLDGPALNRAMMLFLKNLAIFGGLVVIFGMGKGSQKMDRVRVKRKIPKEIEYDDDDQD